MTETHPGVEAFKKANADLAQRGRKMTGGQRAALMKEHFPSLALLGSGDVRDSWEAELAAGPCRNDDDVELVGRILQDIAKHDQAIPGKSGPKPGHLDLQRVYEMLRQFAGDDHTVLPFTQIFLILKGNRSVRNMASKTGLTYQKIQRLSHGQQPSRADMEKIAVSYKKHPSYFKEYRTWFLQDELAQQLESLPEASIDLYRRRTRSNV